MDVQPAPNVGAIDTGNAQASAPSNAPANTPAVPVVQGAVSSSQADGSSQSDSHAGLAPAIAKIFGNIVGPPAQLSVSYRVEGSDIVTVFTDPTTHKEVAQFPPELLLGLAQFFDQTAGVTLDRTA